MRKPDLLRTAAGITLAGILFVAGNYVSGRILGDTGLDVTDRHLYTLSAGTRSILHKIDEPVTLKLYYSSRLGEAYPGYGVYAQRVRETLREYASFSGGKIRLQILDPVPYSDIEDQATTAGLQGAPLSDGGETVYFGLVGTNSTDDVQTIPFFQADRENFLEYDLTKLVQTLAFPKKKVLGMMSALQLDADPMAEMRGQPTAPQAVLDILRENYDIQTIATDADKIPSGIDVLMLVQPNHLPAKTEYAIDQFVLGGGHALVFADPHSEFAVHHPSPGQTQPAATTADFDKLLTAWGVKLAPGKLVGDQLAAIKINTGGDSAEPVDYLLWMTLHGDDINAADPVTGKLTNINLGTAGALEPVQGAKTTFETLLQSSDDAELVDAKSITDAPVPDPLALLKDFKPTGKRYTMAARITGPADTAFPKGAPKDTGIKAPQIKTAAAPINVVVVADTDLLDDRFWIRNQEFLGRRIAAPFAGNGDFVANLADSLAGSNDLISLRARGTTQRPFTLVDKIRREADDRYRAHEQELRERLKATQQKLASIKPPEEGSDTVQLTPDQQKAVTQFQNEIVQTRSELRAVQLALRENIDRVKNQLVLFNLGLVPAGGAAAAFVIGLVRARRRK
jgi:ABC-type uncharacterized transport system involved in gliding motility auxiliary subunit